MIDAAPPPASFLSFIRNGSPGHDFATLAAKGESIDPYIFAGESSTGTDALRFLDALRQVGAVRQWLRGIAGRPESLQMITQNLKSEVMGAADQMSSDSRLIKLMERLHGLANRLGGFPQPRHLTETPAPPDPEFADLNSEGRAAIAAWEAEVGELMQSLQQYYRTT